MSSQYHFREGFPEMGIHWKREVFWAKSNSHDSKVQPGLSSIIIPLYNSSTYMRITILSPPHFTQDLT